MWPRTVTKKQWLAPLRPQTQTMDRVSSLVCSTMLEDGSKRSDLQSRWEYCDQIMIIFIAIKSWLLRSNHGYCRNNQPACRLTNHTLNMPPTCLVCPAHVKTVPALEYAFFFFVITERLGESAGSLFRFVPDFSESGSNRIWWTSEKVRWEVNQRFMVVMANMAITGKTVQLVWRSSRTAWVVQACRACWWTSIVLCQTKLRETKVIQNFESSS